MSIFGAKGSLLRSFIIIQLVLSVLVLITALSSWFGYSMALPPFLYVPIGLLVFAVLSNLLIALKGRTV